MLVSFIVLYLLASIAIGLFAARRVHNTADYAVAGRTLSLPVIIAITFVTWFGAETVLGAPAKFVAEGLHGTVEYVDLASVDECAYALAALARQFLA